MYEMYSVQREFTKELSNTNRSIDPLLQITHSCAGYIGSVPATCVESACTLHYDFCMGRFYSPYQAAPFKSSSFSD